MSKSLVPLTIEAPGFNGLNSQKAGAVLPVGWATKLENFVYDDIGRLASRMGSIRLNASAITNTPTIRQSFEYIDSSGTKLTIFAADNKIFKEVSGTITDISGTITTPTGDDWQFANFNSWVIGFQFGHAPIVMTTVGGSFANSGGTQHNGNMVLSAYGRAWTVLGNTLYFSDLLINNFTGGSSGSFDLAKFWPNGMDEAVALADFNGYLVVFGKNSVLVYESPDDTTLMNIVEGVDGLGCIARDSVQVIGKDIMFLSNTGLRTLGRTIQEKSMPITDVSKNIRDELLSFVAGETKVQIKSVYNSKEGFYLLSLPTAGVSWMFDLKFPNQDGSLKAGRWGFAATSLHYSEGLELFMGITDGYLSKYDGYKDEKVSDGTGGSTYLIDFEGVWNDFGDEVGPLIKIPKRVSILAAGTPGGTVNFKWAMDYSSSFTERQINFVAVSPSRFGISLFAVARFAKFGDFENVRSNLAKSGQVMKVGLSATINNFKFAIQRINILAKVGKLGI